MRRARVSLEVAARLANDTRSLEELLASQERIDLIEAAQIINRQPRFLLAELTTRARNVREQGSPSEGDIPEPVDYVLHGDRMVAVWVEGPFRAWAMGRGKLGPDGRTADQARIARAKLTVERAERRAADTRTLEQRLESNTLLDTYELAELLDLLPQSLRRARMERGEHIKAEGEAWPADMPEPAGHRYKANRKEPRWREGDVVAWAIRVGKLEQDGKTPIPYKPGGVAKD